MFNVLNLSLDKDEFDPNACKKILEIDHKYDCVKFKQYSINPQKIYSQTIKLKI